MAEHIELAPKTERLGKSMKLRKLLSGLVAGCMLAATLMSTAVQAAETGTTVTVTKEYKTPYSSEDFVYDYCSALAGVGITKYTGNATKVTIPYEIDGQRVLRIDKNAFENCTKLTSVSLPGVVHIGAYAFSGCTKLTRVKIPESCDSIAPNAFYGCTSLKNITIPDDTSWNYNSFTECQNLKITYKGDTITCYKKGLLIQDGVLLDCINSAKKIVIPDSVTSIASSAFSNCTKLTSVTIPDSVSNIGWYAFEGCTSLKSIKIPDNTKWSSNAFIECKNLSITYKGITTDCYKNGLLIDGNRLIDCLNSATKVTIPNSVTDIGVSAFKDCTKLASIIVPNSVTVICDSAFENCISLKKVTIPNSVTVIGWYCFKGCTNLTSVNIPSSITNIGSSAFYGCTSLKSIKIPDTTDWEPDAFSECKNLKITYKGKTTACYKNGLYIRDGVLIDCLNSSKKVVIPNTVKTIGYFAFSDCTKLTSITIPNSVTSFEGSCHFHYCTSLKRIKLSDNLKYCPPIDVYADIIYKGKTYKDKSSLYEAFES
ncbi:MAG: leucine-rich repeat domain-containing protein [Oscillospiraceae bacterium]|nr:leucine-rich repeat domain-containing protein [Oscillospiraceae bacterium]